MESEKLEDPASYWRKQYEALERERAKLPPPPVLGLKIVGSERRNKGVGVDLICNSCRQHIPKSQSLKTLCQLFRVHSSSEGYYGTPPPLSRWFARCPNCNQCFRLVRNSHKFIYISGADLTEHQDDDGDLDALHEIYDLDWNDAYPEPLFEIHSDILALVDSPSGVPLTIPKDENLIKQAKAAFRYLSAKYHGKTGIGKRRRTNHPT